MKGVILHGGRGTRLRPLTHTGPKQLIPIANKPMSQYALEDLLACGIRDIAFVLGDIAPEKVVEYYGDGSRFGAKFKYINQGEPKGIAHAVSLVEDFVGGEPFVVYLGDNLLRDGIQAQASGFNASDAAAQILLCRVSNPSAFGVAVLKDNRVARLVEKPKQPEGDLALVGVYMLREPIFDSIRKLKPSGRGELEITDAIQGLMNDGLRVEHHVVRGWWKDTGKPEDILEANHLVLAGHEAKVSGKVEDGAHIIGAVSLGENSVVKKGSTVRGPVVIGTNCEVGPDAYVGPFTSIGDGVVLRDVEIENSIVVGDSLLECGRRIVDSIIGRGARIVSATQTRPQGSKLIVGEHTFISI